MEQTFGRSPMQDLSRELREAGGSCLIPDLPELIEEDELEGGIVEGLDGAFERSMMALEKSFKESLKIIRRSCQEQIGKVEGMY